MTKSQSEIRDIITNNVRAEQRVRAWILSYPQNASSSSLADGTALSGRPVRWQWAPWERGGLKDSLCDIDVEFSDGHRQMITPADLPYVEKSDRTA